MKYARLIIQNSILIIGVFIAPTAFASSASFFITKPIGTVSNGATITLDINVRSQNQSINAVSGTVMFPEDMLRVVSLSTDQSISHTWIPEAPTVKRNKITFQGIIPNPGYKGSEGTLFHVTFEAKKEGLATVSFSDGAVLANDGLGTNIITGLSTTSFSIVGAGAGDLIQRPFAMETPKKVLALPVITEYPGLIDSKEPASFKGKGEPNALTKIVFEDVSHKSFGEQFMDFIQSKKKRLSSVLVKNNEKGSFEYVTPNNLVAGAYNATPFLVDASTNTEKPGLGVRLLVSDSRIIKGLIIFINILILLIPIAGLVMLIYFIPWYSSRRMRIMKRKMGLEEEKIEITQHRLERQDQLFSKSSPPITNNEKQV